MRTFLRESHRTLPAYEPGIHEESGSVIRLNTNESPYPPSGEVLEAIARESRKLNYYNDPDCKALIEALSDRLGVGPENLLIGNGSELHVRQREDEPGRQQRIRARMDFQRSMPLGKVQWHGGTCHTRA